MTDKDSETTEWPVPVREEDIGDKPLEMEISPSKEQAKALAERLEVISLDSLRAHLRLAREGGGQIIHITGRLEGEVTQSCVVTAEPLQNTVSEDFEAWYADPDAAVLLAKARKEREMRHKHGESPILEEHEDPEAIIDGVIDVGELCAQYLCLAIDQYPHAQGAEHELVEHGQSGATPAERENPFAALKDWKEKLTGK